MDEYCIITAFSLWSPYALDQCQVTDNNVASQLVHSTSFKQSAYTHTYYLEMYKSILANMCFTDLHTLTAHQGIDIETGGDGVL